MQKIILPLLLFFACLTLVLFWTYRELRLERFPAWMLANGSTLLLLAALVQPVHAAMPEPASCLDHIPQDVLARPCGHGGAVLVSLALFAVFIMICAAFLSWMRRASARS